jgi:Putative Ig domain
MRHHPSKQNIVWTILFSLLAALTLNACSDSNNVSGPPAPVEPGPLTISSTSLLIGVVGQPYADTVSGSGGTTPYTWSVAPTLPAGLSLNPTTGTITSTPLPTATSSRLHIFTLKDSSSPQQQVQKSLTLTVVNPPPVLTILTTSLPNATVPLSYSFPLQASGGSGALTWSLVAGSLPQNFSLNMTTGLISGTTSAASTAGTSNFTVRVTDTSGQVDEQPLSITIVFPSAPTITTPSLPDGTVTIAYNKQVLATGGTGALAWTVSVGSLPPLLSLNPTTGVISGTPNTEGTFNFTVKATDTLSLFDTRALSIVVNAAPPPLTITTTSLPTGTVGMPYNPTVLQTLQATGGTTPYTWSVTPVLPAPLTLDTSTGEITGTPSAISNTMHTFTVTDSTLPTNLANSITLILQIN